jgi:hypothetical protein
VSDEAEQWRAGVVSAATAEDVEALRDLFATGRSLFGDQLGQEWARTLSALDGRAVTG